MRQDILAASLRVLREEGLRRFTTQRVAAVAGISVGSLYQYFPNKEALIYQIRLERAERGLTEAQRILDGAATPRAKVRQIATMYFRAAASNALRGAELYVPEEVSRAVTERVLSQFTQFVIDADRERNAPLLDPAFAADLLLTTIESVGATAVGRNLPKPALQTWARSVADMVSDHLGFA